MKVVSVINYKGGVGKTTLTACLASFLQRKGLNVLLVDLDPQCNLTGEVLPDRLEELYPLDGRESKSGLKTLREWYYALCDGQTENLEEFILQDRWRRLSIIPSHLDLLDVDTKLAIRLLGTDVHTVHAQPDAGHQRYYNVLNSLRSQLNAIAESRSAKGRGFDLVLLDCPPNFNIVTQTAIIASNSILIPTRPNPLSTMGMDHLIRKRGDLVRDFNVSANAIGLSGEKVRPAKVLGIVAMMWKDKKGRTPIMGNEAVIEHLRVLEGDGIVFYDGVCHNERTFSSKIKAPQIPFSSTPAGDVPNKVRDLIQATCRKIGETLDILKPSFEEVDELLQPLVWNIRESKDDEDGKAKYVLYMCLRTNWNIGEEIKKGLRHVPGRNTDSFKAQVGKIILEKAMNLLPDRESLAKWMAGEVYAEFLQAHGDSKDDAERKSSEFFERSD